MNIGSQAPALGRFARTMSIDRDTQTHGLDDTTILQVRQSRGTQEGGAVQSNRLNIPKELQSPLRRLQTAVLECFGGMDSKKIKPIEDLKAIVDNEKMRRPGCKEIDSLSQWIQHIINKRDRIKALTKNDEKNKAIENLIQIINGVICRVIPCIPTQGQSSDESQSISTRTRRDLPDPTPISPTGVTVPSFGTSAIYPPRTIKLEPVSVTDGAIAPDKRQLLNHSFDIVHSTGYWIDAEEFLNVTLHCTGSGTNSLPEIWIHSLNGSKPGELSIQKVRLKPGYNRIKAKQKGIIYVVNTSPFVSSPEMTVELKLGGKPMPRFKLDTHSDQNWSEILAASPNAPYIELVGDRVIMTANKENAIHYVNDPQKLLALWDKIVVKAEGQFGLLPNLAEPNAPKPGRYHVVEMLANPLSNTAYGGENKMYFPTQLLGTAFNYERMTTNIFLVGHELGHNVEMSDFFTNYSQDLELVTGLTPLYLAQQFPELNLLYRGVIDWSKVNAYLNQKNPDWHSLNIHQNAIAGRDRWNRLALYWQLHLTFGEVFYQNVGILSRQLSPLPFKYDFLGKQTYSNKVEKETRLVTLFSEAAGYDLIPFFEAWGFPVSIQAREYIRSLKNNGKLKDLDKNRPIWKNTDQKVKYKYEIARNAVLQFNAEETKIDAGLLLPAGESSDLTTQHKKINEAEALLLGHLENRHRFLTLDALKSNIDDRINVMQLSSSANNPTYRDQQEKLKELSRCMEGLLSAKDKLNKTNSVMNEIELSQIIKNCKALCQDCSRNISSHRGSINKMPSNRRTRRSASSGTAVVEGEKTLADLLNEYNTALQLYNQKRDREGYQKMIALYKQYNKKRDQYHTSLPVQYRPLNTSRYLNSR